MAVLIYYAFNCLLDVLGEMDTGLHFYNLAKDYLSLVRVYCYCDNLEKVICLILRHEISENPLVPHPQ